MHLVVGCDGCRALGIHNGYTLYLKCSSVRREQLSERFSDPTSGNTFILLTKIEDQIPGRLRSK